MRGQQPLPLFDAELAARAGEAGMAQAGHADRAWPWKLHALEVIEELAATGLEFTADDVVAAVGLPSSSRSNANNAVGALFNAAARRGLILKVGYRSSRRVKGHGRVVAVWAGNPDLDLDPR